MFAMTLKRHRYRQYRVILSANASGARRTDQGVNKNSAPKAE
jgi:hypothetical protein